MLRGHMKYCPFAVNIFLLKGHTIPYLVFGKEYVDPFQVYLSVCPLGVSIVLLCHYYVPKIQFYLMIFS